MSADPETPPPTPPKREAERKIDRDVEETFPASDPPAHTGITGPGDGPKE